MSDGAKRIAAERQRQIDQEGWDAGHDDAHSRGSLVKAAIAYAASAIDRTAFEYWTGGIRHTFQDFWPWEPRWDKRKEHSRIRKLEIAGALIAAEIDRLLRASKPTTGRYRCPGCGSVGVAPDPERVRLGKARCTQCLALLRPDLETRGGSQTERDEAPARGDLLLQRLIDAGNAQADALWTRGERKLVSAWHDVRAEAAQRNDGVVVSRAALDELISMGSTLAAGAMSADGTNIIAMWNVAVRALGLDGGDDAPDVDAAIRKPQNIAQHSPPGSGRRY